MDEGSSGPDRRLLAAFYTQYVALLLILITYTVGLLAGAPITTQNVHEELPVKSESHHAPQHQAAMLGTFSVSNIFLDDGRVASENSELAAIATVLRAHDVSAVVRLSVPRLGVPNDSSSVRRALRRIESLEAFFADQHVPDQAFRILVEEGSLSTRDVEVNLQAVRGAYEQ